ncbi:MAG TPA: hypothetical protein VGQ59_08020 [Cyclobacteriaceae bacterium]|jgi:hypothetical protein|nr:hypothetical protein [Cyclobacteriaceae bacterium]
MKLKDISNKMVVCLWLGLFIFVVGCEKHEDVTPSSQSSPSQVSTPLHTQPCLLTSLATAYGKYNYLYTGDKRLSEIQHVLSDPTTPYEQWKMGYTNGLLTTVSYYIQYSGSVTPVVYTFEYGPNNKPSKLTQSQGTYLLSTITYKYDTKDRLVMGEENLGGGVAFTFKYEYGVDNNVSKKYMATYSNALALAAVHHTYDNRERFFAASPDLTLVEIYLFKYDPSVSNLIASTVYFDATAYSQTTFSPYLAQTFTYAQNGYITSIINEASGQYNYSWLFTFYGATYSCK